MMLGCHTQPDVKITLIEIKPFSMSGDKPIDTLRISYDQHFLVNDKDWIHLSLIDKNTFKKVVNFVQSKKTEDEATSISHLEDGIFIINMFNGDRIVTSYTLKSHQISQRYLYQLMAMLRESNSDKELIDEIDKLLLSINY